MNAKLRDSEADKNRYHEQLVATERRLDRLQSKVVASLNPDTQRASQPSGTNAAEDQENKATPDPISERAPSVSSVSHHTNIFRHSKIRYLLCLVPASQPPIPISCSEWRHPYVC